MPSLTNNRDLRLALTTQPREKLPRMEVTRDGKPIPFEDLEKMASEDLINCEIKSFTHPVTILSHNDSEYKICGGPGHAETFINRKDPASKSLESFYQIGIISGSY